MADPAAAPAATPAATPPVGGHLNAAAEAHANGKSDLQQKIAQVGASVPLKHLKTEEQRNSLEAAYLMQAYPKEEQYAKLAQSLSLTLDQVRHWFVKRRSKDRKENPNAEHLNNSLGGGARKNEPSPLPGALPPMHTNARAKAVGDPPELISLAKALMPVPYRCDGPRLAYVFDEVPSLKKRSRGGALGEAAPSSRKRRAAAGSNLVLSRYREEERNRRKEEQDLLRRQKAAEREAERQIRMHQKMELLERREQERLQRVALKRQRDEELLRMKEEREAQKHRDKIAKQQAREEAMARKKMEQEERKRLREAEKLRAAAEKAAMKEAQLKGQGMYPDDEDIEAEALGIPKDAPVQDRPPFPPPPSPPPPSSPPPPHPPPLGQARRMRALTYLKSGSSSMTTPRS